MGTRGLTAVVKDGQFVVAQYGQWDHYPSGQGRVIVEFLRQEDNVDRLLAGLEHTYLVTREQLEDMWKQVGVTGEYATLDQSKKFSELYPSMTRDTGARILELVARATADKKLPLQLTHGFGGDSLFCEWAYVIDLDNAQLEVFQGFNKTPTPPDSRFPSGADWLEKGSQGYEPVRLLKAYPFRGIPTVEKFVAELEALAYSEDEVA